MQRTEIPAEVQRGRETQSLEVLSHRVFRATNTLTGGPCIVEVVVTQATITAGGDRVGTVCWPTCGVYVDGQYHNGSPADHLDEAGLPRTRTLIFGTEIGVEAPATPTPDVERSAARGIAALLSELRHSFRHHAETAQYTGDPSTLAHVTALAVAIEAVEEAQAEIVATTLDEVAALRR